jgi:hypothetical protein
MMEPSFSAVMSLQARFVIAFCFFVAGIAAVVIILLTCGEDEDEE